MKEFLRKTNGQDNNGLQLTKRIYQLNELKPTIIIFYLKILLSVEVGVKKQKREIKRKIVIPQFGYNGRKEKCRNYFP